jgi:hypothetical protein
MLDMSIGEATIPLGRRPQFTQERSATKKVPLQAGATKTSSPSGQGFLPNRKARSSPSCGQTLTCSLGLCQICLAFPGR